jgi:preprotein translocase subunit SecD
MKIHGVRFNLNLFAGGSLARFAGLLCFCTLLGFLCGCRTEADKLKKQTSTLKIHIEATPDSSNRTRPVSVFRASPVVINIDKNPILTEALVREARVIEDMGTFQIRLQFDRRGTWILEQYSNSHRGRRLAIFSQFEEKPGAVMNAGRWLAAPVITRRVSDGLIVFSPDATREECEQIVRGLNNLAREASSTDRW